MGKAVENLHMAVEGLGAPCLAGYRFPVEEFVCSCREMDQSVTWHGEDLEERADELSVNQSSRFVRQA